MKRKKAKTAMALLLRLSTSPLEVCAKPTKIAKSKSCICEYMMQAPRKTPVAIGVFSCGGNVDRWSMSDRDASTGGEFVLGLVVLERTGLRTRFMVMVPPMIIRNKISMDQMAAKPAAWFVVAVSRSFWLAAAAIATTT